MKLNILPEQPRNNRKGPEFVITVNYENEIYREFRFPEFTQEMKRFIEILLGIEKRYDEVPCYFSEELDRLDQETHEFLINLDEDLVCEFKGAEYAYTRFDIKYLDKNGYWHKVEIED